MMTETDSPATVPPKSSVARLFRNIAWLLGGKGFAAVCSVIYLAILARTLGLKGFGHFSLITGTAQALAAIAGFQTWRVVVRFGVSYVNEKQWEKFGRLVMLCAGLDVLGAICGCLLAWVLIYGFSAQLSLNPAYIHIAFVYCCLSMFSLTSAMTGVLRTIDRFDLMIYVETVPMVARLLASLGIWWWGASVHIFLIAWGAIGLVEALIYWVMAARIAPGTISLRHLASCRQAIKENPGIGSFGWVTYAGGTLEALTSQGPLLAVGAFVGTQSAGLYRMASQLAQSLGKVSSLLTRAVYPEITRAHFTTQHHAFRSFALRISAVAGSAGILVVVFALFAGGGLLSLIGGSDFGSGGAILVGLAVAASFDLASVAFEPVLHSTGRAQRSLTARFISAVVLGLGLVLLLPIGAVGAAWAVALRGLVSYAMMGAMAWFALARPSAAAPPAD